MTVSALSLLTDFCFWYGQNWARVLTMISCALSPFVLTLLPQYNNPLSKLFLVLQTVFYCYLFFWLTRPPVAAYFKSRKNPAPR